MLSPGWARLATMPSLTGVAAHRVISPGARPAVGVEILRPRCCVRQAGFRTRSPASRIGVSRRLAALPCSSSLLFGIFAELTGTPYAASADAPIFFADFLRLDGARTSGDHRNEEGDRNRDASNQF